MTRTRTAALALLLVGTGALAPATAPAAPGDKQAKHEAEHSKKLRKELTVEGVREHQQAFQTHSDLNGGNRVAGSPGFEASADYVAARAEAAGYTVSRHAFEFLFNADRTPPTLRQEAPTPTTYVDGVDFSSMTFSDSINLTTAPVWAVDLVLPKAPGPGATTSGCESGDFAGMPAGSIALMQRGTCTFGVKSANARNAGAVAAVIFNDGGDAGREGVINGTLGAPDQGVAVGTTLAAGQQLAQGIANGSTGTVASIRVDRVEELRTTDNVIAESPVAKDDNVVVVGAHLDSVPRGPGVNDNGSGSATILEIAESLSKKDGKGFKAPKLRNHVRFMWFSAEEFGLLGSAAYVASLPQAERDRIVAMINFDMVGSPNYVRGVYDGDNSAFPVGPGSADGPPGSGEIERMFRDYFLEVGLTSGETPFSGRSDYGPFIAAGVDIPAGGLFTGAEGIKTAAEQAVYGGTADQPYDSCYHLACDTFANVNLQGLTEMSDAAAHTAITLADRDYGKDPLVDPATPVGGTDGTGTGGGGGHGPELATE